MKKFWVVIFLALLWLMLAVQSSSAQGQAPTATLSTTPDPTLAALETTVTAQETQIADLGAKLDDRLGYEKREREFADRDLLWKWGLAASIGGIFLVLATWFGFNNIQDAKKKVETARRDWEKNVRDLEKEWEQRAALMLDKAIFRLDPSNLPVHLPADLIVIHQALTRRELGRIEFYDNLDELQGDKLKGVIVISMTDKEKLEGDQNKFLEFVSRHKLDPALTGIILYTGPNRVDDKVSTAFENLVTANYPATVVSMILVVGRGIRVDPPSQKNQ